MLHALPTVAKKQIFVEYIRKEMRRELKHITKTNKLNEKQGNKGINDLTPPPTKQSSKSCGKKNQNGKLSRSQSVINLKASRLNSRV